MMQPQPRPLPPPAAELDAAMHRLAVALVRAALATAQQAPAAPAPPRANTKPLTAGERRSGEKGR